MHFIILDYDMNFSDYIATVPDFPNPGILFYDISPLLADGRAWRIAIETIAAYLAPYKPDKIVGIESRGFLVAAPLAMHMGIGFVMIRKKGKLPGKTKQLSYDLEYGHASIEIQNHVVESGQNLVVVDDILATGGTMSAAIKLLQQFGGNVLATAYLIELKSLQGRQKVQKPCHSLIQY